MRQHFPIGERYRIFSLLIRQVVQKLFTSCRSMLLAELPSWSLFKCLSQVNYNCLALCSVLRFW